MSVEEARVVLENEMLGRACSPMIDRLILEAQAEMPCYPLHPDTGLGVECYAFSRLNPGNYLCPSCKSRAELAAMKEPVQA